MGMEKGGKIEQRRREEEGWRTYQIQELFFQVNIFFSHSFFCVLILSLKKVREKETKRERERTREKKS